MASAQVLTHTEPPPVVLYPGQLSENGGILDQEQLSPPLGVDHYYRQYKEKDYLHRSYLSDYVHSPQQIPPRFTSSDLAYDKMLERQAEITKTPKVPWGRERSYAGIMSVRLPQEHRPKAEPPEKVEKGNRHFGSGVNPFPRGVPVEQNYQNAGHILSKVRTNDELVPSAEKVGIRAHVVDESFPADHPYASHIPRTALLPNFDNPADPQKGPPGHMATHEAKAPAPTIVKMKTFGNDRRHEVQKDQMPSEKFPYQYQPNNINYYQEVKKAEPEHKKFYPTPMKALHPNLNARAIELAVSPRTANALHNCERNLMRTSYSTHYTGYGTMNSLKLDNWDEFKDLYARNKFATSAPLSARSEPHFVPPRPLEGRISKLLWQRGSLKQPELNHYSESHDVIDANKELVDDHRAYQSLPAGYTEILKKAHADALRTCDYSLTKLWEKPITDEEQKKLIEERTEAMEKFGTMNSQFLVHMSEKQQVQLKQLEAYNLWKKTKLLQPKDQIIQYRSQMNYVIPIEQPNTFFDHSYKIITARAPFIFEGDNPYTCDNWKSYTLAEVERPVVTSLNDPCPTTEEEVQLLQKEEELKSKFKTTTLNFPQYTRAATAPEIKIPMDMLGSTLTRTLGRPYSHQKLLHVKGRLEPNELKPEVKSTGKEVVLLDEKRLGAGVRPTFHNHPEERVIANVDHINAHHVYRHNNAAEEQAQYTARTVNDQSIVKQVSFKDTVDTALTDKVDPDYTWWRDYNASLSQSNFPEMGIKMDNYISGMEDRPNFGLYASIPKYNSRLLQSKNDFNKSAVRKEFHDSFPEKAPDLRDHISEGKKHNFFGYNAYYYH